MTQHEFNEHVVEMLEGLLKHLREDRPSEPKHGIVGSELADKLKSFQYQLPVQAESDGDWE